MSPVRILTVLLVANTSLAGCGALRTPYVRPTVITPERYPHADDNARASLDGWWHSFDDRNLDSLVELALARNLDLAAAALRLRAAGIQQHLAVINPTFTLDYTYEKSKPLSGHLPS